MSYKFYFLFLTVVTPLLLCVRAKSPRAHHKNISEYIINGNVVPFIEMTPYMVQVSSYGELFCGGTILTTVHVLTAAHCLCRTWRPTAAVEVRSGSPLANTGGVITSVRRWACHKWYKPQSHDYDVAIMHLQTRIPLNDATKLIHLSNREPNVGESADVIGWGRTIARSFNLMAVQVSIVEKQKCQKKLVGFTDRMICATNGPQGACFGDSGGPLATRVSQIGVVSFGNGCGRPGVPAAYTSVLKVQDFIDFETEGRAIWNYI